MKLTGFQVGSSLVVDVVGCARCGGDHPNRQFLELSNAQDEYGHWSLCPYTGEPLLCKVIRGPMPGTKGEG